MYKIAVISLITLILSAIYLIISTTIKDEKATRYYKETGKTKRSIPKTDQKRITEYEICEQLAKILPYSATILNAQIPTENAEKNNEINIIFITQYGLYLIESRDFAGEISGNQYDERWYCTKNEYHDLFENPIVEAHFHQQLLKKYLEKQKIYYSEIYPIVCFGEKATMKNVQGNIPITKVEDLYLYLGKTKPVLTMNEIQKIYNVLKPLSKIINT